MKIGSFRLRAFMALIIIVLGIGLGNATAQETLAQTTTALYVRTGPGEDYPTTALLSPDTWVALEARDAATDWVLVHTRDEDARGWVSTCCVLPSENVNLDNLPIADELVAQTAHTTENLRLRERPGERYDIITVLPEGTTVILEGPIQGVWVPVRVPGSDTHGWVSSCCLVADGMTDEEPVTFFTTPTAPYTILPEREAELIAKLTSTPILPEINEHVRQIFAYGQSLGNHADVFAKVGDCLTSSDVFLTPFGIGTYELGTEYAYLQETIKHFAGAFSSESQAAVDGLTAAAVLDPIWADPAVCRQGESPLVCEYRLKRPAVAIIMFGTMDITMDVQGSYSPAQFSAYMSEIVQTSLDQGIIPILTTFPSNPNLRWAESLEFNAVIIDIALQEQIPLINYWLAAQKLLNAGLDGDNSHPSHHDNDFISFAEDEPGKWGQTLHNLLVLQMLDKLRQEVLTLKN